jgi:hypothetical protein
MTSKIIKGIVVLSLPCSLGLLALRETTGHVEMTLRQPYEDVLLAWNCGLLPLVCESVTLEAKPPAPTKPSSN